ncbi:mercury methylation corrinoid protein HgcA [Thermodesulfobacteriota bacterium]
MEKIKQNKADCGKIQMPCSCGEKSDLEPLFTDSSDQVSCCGFSPKSENTPFERPGFKVQHFVETFVKTPAGLIPRVKIDLKLSDITGTVKTRLGIGRDNYKVAPGLYCVGNPGSDDPVMVTANYKLSFDILRKALVGLNSWILVLDTKGVNVWCAAGKRTFSTEEVIQRVKVSGLEKVVTHRELILPQLSATGVSARSVKKSCGFKVIWGPVRARDIKRFIEAGKKADTSMRRVTFSILERIVLVPVELSFLPKPTLWILLAVFLLSGIGSDVFSLSTAWNRGLLAVVAYMAGVFAGAVAAPVLLPWIPGRAFFLKGIQTGLFFGIGVVFMFWNNITGLEAFVLLLFTTVVSSYLAMNFTGSTPFTSPSGVEKEMRKAIPIQVCTTLVAVVAWVASAFTG